MHPLPFARRARARVTDLHSLRAAFAWGFLAILLAAPGCQNSERELAVEPATPRPIAGGTFRLMQVEPSSLDPAKMDDTYEAALLNQIYEGLLRSDSNANVFPGVATSWQISRDGMSYTFRLRRGVRFHDGSELQSDDVVFSLSRIFRIPESESYLAREYLSHVAGVHEFARGESESIEGLKALGPYSLRITLKHPYASFLSVLASEITRIVSKQHVQDGGDLDHSPVGCGPFRLARWEPGRSITLERFEGYHGKKAHLDRLVFLTPVDDVRQKAVQAFLEGAVDAVELTSGRLSEISKIEDAAVHRRQELSLTFIGFGTRVPPFDDLRLRAAFAHAIDLDALTSIREGGRMRPNGMLPPGFPGYTPASKTPPCDLELSRRLLAEAGFPGGSGLPRIVHGIANPSDSDRALMEGIRQQVARVGFELDVRVQGWDDFDSRLRDGSFQTFSLSWVADIPDPDSFFYPLFHSRGSVNYTGYHSAEVDALLDAGRRGETEGPRINAYRRIERLLLEDLPVIPINHSVAVVAVRGNVRGFSITPMGMGDLSLEEVWLDPSPFKRELVAR